LYQFLLFVHVLAAATWIGAAIRHLVEAPMVAGGEPGTRAVWNRVNARLGTKLFAPAAVLVLVSGIWMVTINDAVGFGTLFVSIGFAAVIFGAVMGPAVFGKRGEKAAELFEGGDVEGAEAVERSVRPFALLDVAVLVVAAAAMVFAWGT
jgi:hypothetical protein